MATDRESPPNDLAARFCVYEHWRPDIGVCFYVGKGTLRRATKTQRRNREHSAIANVLLRGGMAVQVHIIRSGIGEAEAFRLERERIAHWRAAGVRLCNRTDGGEGTSGHRFTRPPRGESHRQKLAIANAGKKKSPKALQKLRRYADTQRGIARTTETKNRISAAKKGTPGIKGRIPWCKGKRLSAQTREKMSAARRGKTRGPMSFAQRLKISYSLRGRSNLALKGKRLSPEHRKKLIDAWSRRKARKLNEQTVGRSSSEISQSA